MKPTKLGQPCWNVTRVSSVITTIAKMDASRTDDFLACHSPIHNIRDERANRYLSEEELFQALMDPMRDHVLAVVYGDPGTGKSHLIHWLKLRSDHALKTGELRGFLPVLIQRRTGSLKDALEQLVQQLPAEFARYLDPVRQAISNISDREARVKLAQEIALELSERLAGRGRPALSKYLKALPEVCRSLGFREWLCRDGGAIDRNIRRLTSSSSADDRLALPEFGKEDFLPAPKYHRDNIPDVEGLIDDFREDDRMAPEAAQLFNLVLRSAIAEMSGLGGNKLRTLLDDIRRELRQRGETLGLFVEDVSVMSSLDREVFNAVEPQSRPELCRLVGVLGMTSTGKDQLAENELQRITHLVSVSESAKNWRDDRIEVAQFAARYLNVVRLDEAAVHRIAEGRRARGDVNVSACTDCPVVGECHAVFGSVDFDGVAVGLYPFSEYAPQHLLLTLEERGGVRRNQRGLLDQVMRPLLADVAAFDEARFPRIEQLPVRLEEPADWSVFVARYCGGWSQETTARLKALAQAWIHGDSPEAYAATLKPLIEPLGFPSFSARAVQMPKPRPAPEPPPKPAQAPPPKATEELRALLTALGRWLDGEELKDDTAPRELLLDFLRKSLPIEEARGLPRAEFDRLLADKSCIRIEGQRSRAAGQLFFIDFPRSEETRALIEALARFKLQGGGTWAFSNPEHHKRVVGQWLLKREERVLEMFQPAGLAPWAPVTSGVHVLCLTAVLRRRQPLLADPAELVKEVTAKLDRRPDSLSRSSPWSALLDQLEQDQDGIIEFVLREVNVPQGSTGGRVFIDPLPILRAAREFHQSEQVSPVPGGYFKSFWKPRYVSLERVQVFAELDRAVAAERAAVAAALAELREKLKGQGYAADDLGAAVAAFCREVCALVEVLKVFPVPSPDFDARKSTYRDPESWLAAIRQALAAARSTGVLETLCFEPAPFRSALDAGDVAVRFADQVEAALTRAEAALNRAGDPVALAGQLLEELRWVAGLDAQEAAAR